MRQRRFGRLPRRLDALAASVIHYSALKAMRAVQLPALMQEVHQAGGLPQHLGVMLNDREGDCSCAGLGHLTQVWTADAQGQMVTIPDADIQSMYEAFGFNPNAPLNPDGSNPTDNGAVLQDVLLYATNTGILMPDNSRSKLLAWIEVDPRNPTDVCEAIQECGSVYIGIRVPSALPMDAGSIWGGGANMGIDTGEGHCVILTGFDDPTNPTYDVISWGDRFTMTPDFWQNWVDEIYGLFSPLWIAKTGRTPWNLDPAMLASIMQAIRGVPT
jgi:hypothetical protein